MKSLTWSCSRLLSKGSSVTVLRIFIVLIVVLTILLPGTQPAKAAAGSILYSPNLSLNPDEDASYPRVIRLSNSGSANGTLLSIFSNSGNGQAASLPIYESTDGGQTWSSSPISVVTDTLNGWSLDGPTLFEFPQTLGSYPAGTLLAAGTAWDHGPIVDGRVTQADYTQQAIEVFVSTDHGYNWSYLSSCTSESGLANTQGHGIWEPSFQVDSNGDLVCYFSDERQSGNGYNQLIAHVVSSNGGQSWGSEVYDVAIQDSVQRPGMPIVIKLPNGEYLMSFEECKAGYDPDQACSVYVKTSADGDDWSPVTSTGSLVQTSDGRHFLHTPYVAWSPVGGTNGTVIITGQRLVTGSDGSITVLPESGKTFLINTNLGSGDWYELPAAFVIDPTGGYDSGETGCPAYSSPILPSETGTSLLYMAGTVISNGNCEVRYGFTTAGALPFYASLAGGTDAGWATYGGTWSVSNGIYSDSASGAGHKAVAGSTGWTDYTLQGDVELTSAGQAGLIFRVTNPDVGADAFNGYYVGLESTSGTLFLGRENGSWTGLTSTSMSVAINTWYHVTVQAVGCVITVSAQAVGTTGNPTSFTYNDSGCSFTSGQIGVRDHYTTASWRNISVTSGGTTSTTIPPYYAPFAGGAATGWTSYDGTWSVSGSNETYSDSAGGTGDKSVAGSTGWTDYTLQGDVQLTSAGQNANPGFIVRVTNPAVGADALDGYYAGITADGDLVVGNEDYGWTYLGGAAIPGGVSLNDWYHIIFQVQGCDLTISAQSVASADQAIFSYTDCTQSAGQIGVRTYNAAASWRYISVSPN